MANITEDYVSFEIAKLLREKGFSENTEHEIWYVIKQFSTGCHWNSCTYKVGDITREYNGDCCIPMPTLQMAMKWLREEYRISVEISALNHNHWIYTIYRLFEEKVNELYNDGTYISYEDATNEALKYCLEHLI